MTVDLELSRLCCFINESLSPFIELDLGSVRLTKEMEKNLLIALSKIYREIQTWIRELEVDSDEETTVSECLLEATHEDHNCLMRILDDMILLLTVHSQFIQHSVGKILVCISNFLDLSGSKSDSFVDSLFMCLALILNRLLFCSVPPRCTGNLHFDSSVLVDLNRGRGHANWSTAAHIIETLRRVLKNLKQESDDKRLRGYEKFVYSFLSNIPWDCMDEMYAKEPKVVFLGSLIPFLCSLVEQATAPETNVDLQDQHSILSIVINLVPKLLCWCVGKRETVNQPTCQYFTHKLLMLMLRLSYRTHLSCTTLVSWLQLLHDYFEELLLKPISLVKPGAASVCPALQERVSINAHQLITLFQQLTWYLTWILLQKRKELRSSTDGYNTICKMTSLLKLKCAWTIIYFLQDLFSGYTCMRMTYYLRFFCSWLVHHPIWNNSQGSGSICFVTPKRIFAILFQTFLIQ